MGGAVIFVITPVLFVTGLIYKYILTLLNVQYLVDHCIYFGHYD